MDQSHLSAALQAAGLGRIAADIEKIQQPSVRLVSQAAGSQPLKTASSRLGGLPDLPQEISWPLLNGTPQSFIAQIRLEEIKPYISNVNFPANGLLYFFYDAHQETYGEKPADRGGWQVIYYAGDPSRLVQRSAPPGLPAEAIFKACRLSFSSEITFPGTPNVFLPNLDWTEDEQTAYEDFIYNFPGQTDRATSHNRMFGNSDTIQDDMHLQCALMANGISSVDDPGAAAFEKTALDWQLLLQVDSDDNAGMKWASAGLLYFWIKRDELAAGHFENTWLVLQSD
ncbi:MAG: YwqG family protein [Anaerolineaceae bacterium]|nr:YwqG family protein [Anaerolineaceae bacterium]